ncbi:hypothetical protein KDAU_61350 [Dictyobacter aurantiacus]|uniref:Uncharacterized protein n=1 Tax=Dictyobacter aurantiacus TaxID=1936993 RepID=A0A401ZPW8_9CHLR|nr:hypothetical protein KDAU_61350 [Dictyobacter aurantiacus]
MTSGLKKIEYIYESSQIFEKSENGFRTPAGSSSIGSSKPGITYKCIRSAWFKSINEEQVA